MVSISKTQFGLLQYIQSKSSHGTPMFFNVIEVAKALDTPDEIIRHALQKIEFLKLCEVVPVREANKGGFAVKLTEFGEKIATNPESVTLIP